MACIHEPAPFFLWGGEMEEGGGVMHAIPYLTIPRLFSILLFPDAFDFLLAWLHVVCIDFCRYFVPIFLVRAGRVRSGSAQRSRMDHAVRRGEGKVGTWDWDNLQDGRTLRVWRGRVCRPCTV